MGYRTHLQTLQIRGGGGRPKQSDRVRWHELQAAFQSRIRTGCITNLQHLEPRAFLADAKSIFARRIENTLKTTAFLKVNCTFSGKFTKPDVMEDDIKYIQTKNAIINRGTDLDAWWTEHVEELILRELEEFQVSF